MSLSKRILLSCFILLANNLITKAQLLTLDRCFSGTKDDSYYFGFKFSETDSNRYIVIESYSENNIFDTIDRNIYPLTNAGSQNFYLLKLNENTKEAKTKFINYINRPNVLNNQVAVTFITGTSQDSIRNTYGFKINSDLDSASPLLPLEHINVIRNSVNWGGIRFYVQDGDTCYAYGYYENLAGTIHSIIRYKFDNTHFIGASFMNTLRYDPQTYRNQLYIKNSKIYEYYNGLLKIYNANADEIVSYTIYNNPTYEQVPIVKDLGNGELLLVALSDSIRMVKIKNDNTLAYNVALSTPGNQSYYSLSAFLSTDANFLVQYYDNDSTYYIRYDSLGNIIHWYAEKFGATYGQIYQAIDYNDSVKIVLKNKNNAGTLVYIQKIDRNGIPLSSVQVNQTIFYQNKILSLTNVSSLTKTRENRYFGVANYSSLFGGNYVIFEYNPINNSLLLSAVMDSGIPQEIFSNNKNETYVIATVNDGCIRNKDVVLYKLSGGYNTVKGKVYIDYNNNNTQDTGEPLYENARLSYAKNGVVYSSYLIDTGIYSFLIDTGRYDIACRVLDSLFTVSPAIRTVSHTTYNNTDFVNFILKPIGVVYDAEVTMNNTFRTRPGFNGTYALNYANNGNYPISNYTVKTIIDNRLAITSASTDYTVNADTLIWNNLPVLQPGERKTIFINFTAATPPTLNNGDIVQSVAWINIPQNDTNLNNNQFKFSETVRTSYDPNEKTVNEDALNSVDLINNKNLVYTIRFENTGNDTAFNITIQDTLPVNVNLNSFKPIASSYPYTISVKNNNILTFYFKGIKLPTIATNPDAAHGFVSYEIRPDKNFSAQNFEIKNTAHITFDYNLPLSTNTATTLIQVVSAVINKSLQDKIFIYPNPAKEQINIQLKNILLNNATLKLVDISGNIILSQKVTENNNSIDVHLLASGTYVLIFENDHQVQTSKVIITR